MLHFSVTMVYVHIFIVGSTTVIDQWYSSSRVSHSNNVILHVIVSFWVWVCVQVHVHMSLCAEAMQIPMLTTHSIE